jgi:hypothetical protein
MVDAPRDSEALCLNSDFVLLLVVVGRYGRLYILWVPSFVVDTSQKNDAPDPRVNFVNVVSSRTMTLSAFRTTMTLLLLRLSYPTEH